MLIDLAHGGIMFSSVQSDYPVEYSNFTFIFDSIIRRALDRVGYLIIFAALRPVRRISAKGSRIAIPVGMV